MKNSVLILFTVLCVTGSVWAQNVGINATGATPDVSAILDVSANNRGLLIPRMTQAQRNAISTPATSLLIYQTDNNPGFYFYNGSTWVTFDGDMDWLSGTGTIYNLTDQVGVGMTPPTSGGQLNVGGLGLYVSGYSQVEGTSETDRLVARDAASGLSLNDTLAVFEFSGASLGATGVYIENSNGGPALEVVSNQLIAGEVAIKSVGDTAIHATGNTAVFARGDSRFSPTGASADWQISNIGIEPSLLPATNNYGYIGSNANRIYQGHFSSLTVYGTFSNLSDRSIKENIAPLKNPLEQILALNGRKYDLKSGFVGSDQENNATKKAQLEKSRMNKIGFIAQEVEEVLPNLVRFDAESGLKSVDYIGVIPILVEAIKEQQGEIEILRSQIEKQKVLEERIKRLEELLKDEN